MKKGLSLILCLMMLVSMVSMLSVTASAADVKNAIEITKTNFKDDIIKFDIYLKKDISVSGAVFRVEFDPEVLEPVSDPNSNAYMTKNAYGEEMVSVSGSYAAGTLLNRNDLYGIGYISGVNPYVSNAKKGFMTVSFRVIDDTRPVTDIKFYCIEFNSENTSLNIPKNEVNPQNFYTYSGSTMNQSKITSVYSVENGLRINWEKTEGAVGYKVFKIADGKSTLIGDTANLFFDDTSAVANETTSYAVRAYDAAGNLDSGYAGSMSGVYVKAPSKVAVSLQTNGVKVGWYLVDGAESYKVFRREIFADGSKSDWTEIYTAGNKTTTYIDRTTVSGKQYEFTVRAYTAKGASAVCRFASTWFYTAPTVTTTAVVGGVNVKWDAIPGANTYNIYRKYNGASSWTLIATVEGNVTTYLDKDAISGRNIDYTVRAFGKTNQGSSTFTAKRIAYVGVPHLTSVANSVGGLTVKWTAVQNATGYRVYRRAAGEKYFTYLGTVTSTTYVDKTVRNGVYYKYTVRTVFYSLFSNYEAGLLCRYVATPKLTSISNATNGIKITWGAVSGATGYRVYRRGAGQTTWTYLGTVTGTSYTDTSVKDLKGQYFRYTVRAVNGYYSGFDTNGLYIKRS